MGWPAEQPVLECKTACSALQNGPYFASKRPMLPAGHCTRVGAGQQCRVSECFRLPRFTVKYALPYCFTPAFIMMRFVVWFSRWRCSEPFFPKSRTSVATVEAGFVYATFMHHRHRPSSSRGLPTGMHSRACSAVMAACFWPLA